VDGSNGQVLDGLLAVEASRSENPWLAELDAWASGRLFDALEV
jgi:hypothetical protein